MNVPVITGVGIVSCLGTGMAAHRSALAAPVPAVASIVADPHAHVADPLYALAAGPDGGHDAPASELAELAAEEAFRDAVGSAKDLAGSRVSVIMASSVADARVTELARTSGRPLPASDFAAVAAVRRRIGLPDGPGYELSNACAGSGYAISLGCDLIAAGRADVVIAGGSESYSRVTVAAFNAMAALSTSGISRPFDRHRDGVVLGEGAAVVVLESAAHALSRGASSYAALSGAGWSCDAYHPMAPDPAATQVTRAMREALRRAGITPADIGCVIPHGTGTPLNDVVESRALAMVFGDAMEKLPLYSLKAAIGHLAGGSAAASVVLAAAGLQSGRLSGNIPVADPDPECAVYLPTDPIDIAGRGVLVNAYAAGGNNISLVLQEHK